MVGTRRGVAAEEGSLGVVRCVVRIEMSVVGKDEL